MTKCNLAAKLVRSGRRVIAVRSWPARESSPPHNGATLAGDRPFPNKKGAAPQGGPDFTMLVTRRDKSQRTSDSCRFH